MPTVPERDWQVLKQLKPVALDRLCRRILDDLLRAAAAPERSNHERYRDVFALIRDRDQQIADAFDGLSRSSALLRIAIMRSRGLFTDEEFARFSEETREAVERALKPF